MRPFKLLFAFYVSICTLSATAQQKNSLPPGLDKYIQNVMDTFNVPGMAISIVKDGKVILAKGYGVKRAGTNDKVDENTLFLIASNSKIFTAVALAILVEEGKIKWDDPVINHLPWFRMSNDYVTSHITIRDLLVHHSGLPAYAGDVMLFPPSSYTRREILEKLAEMPLIYGFRTTYAYDNILYLAAAEIIEGTSGIGWEEFIKTRIFDKAGMTGSLSRFSLIRQKKNVSSSHTNRYNELRVNERFMDLNIGDAGNAAGGIVSNAADMANWLITQLDSGRAPTKNTIYKPSSTNELWKIVRPLPVGLVPAELKPSQADFSGYALGLRIYNYQRYKVVGHGGTLSGFVSQVAMVPDLRLGISVLTNQQTPAAYWSVIYHVLDHYMGNKSFDWIRAYKHQVDSALRKSISIRKKQELKPDSMDRPSLSLEKYTGIYNNVLLGDIILTKNPSGLELRFSNAPHYIADLEYYQYNNFFAKFRDMGVNANAFLTFTINPNGSIKQALLKDADRESNLDLGELILEPADNSKMDTVRMRKAILTELSRHPEGVFGIAFKDAGTGKTFFMNEHKMFHAASTMKTPVLIEAYKQAAAGKFQISDPVIVKNEFKSIVDGSIYSLDSTDDSEHDLYSKIGSRLPLYDLLHRMITSSSNLATNIVIDFVGAENVNKSMRELGAKNIQVLRGVEDNKAYEKGLNNTTTAYDLMLIMENLANGKAVNRESSDAMIKILMDQQLRDKIPKKLPPEVKVACKTGSITAVSHDSGIVYLPDGRKYILVLLSEGVKNLEDVNNTLANVSKIIYDFVK